MMDVGITSAAAGLDVATAAKAGAKTAGQENADKKGGFMEALTHVRDSVKENGKKTGGQTNGDALALAPGEEQHLPETGLLPEGLPTPVKAKPVIDIRGVPAHVAETPDPRHADSNAVDAKRFAKIARQAKEGEQADGTADGADDVLLPADAGIKPKARTDATRVQAVPADSEGDVPPEKTPTTDAMTLLGGEGGRTPTAAEAGFAAQQFKSEMKTMRAAGSAESEHPHIASSSKAAAESPDGLDMPDTAGDTASEAQTFRLSRAGNRNQSMDMIVGGAQRDSAQAETKSSGGFVDTITVLDSRRYLGLAQNAGSLVDTLSGDPEWRAAMQASNALSNAASMASTGRVVNTLKLQLHPISLGMVTATLRLTGDELSVELTVNNAAAYRQMNEDQKSIVESLRAQGFVVDQVTVTLVAADKADAGTNQPGSQNQSFGQQAAQDGNGGTASRKDDDNAQQRSRGGPAGTDEATVDDAGGTGGTRPGHVYI